MLIIVMTEISEIAIQRQKLREIISPYLNKFRKRYVNVISNVIIPDLSNIIVKFII